MLKRSGVGRGLSFYRKLRGAGYKDPVQAALTNVNVDLGKAYDAQLNGNQFKAYAEEAQEEFDDLKDRAQGRKKKAMDDALVRLCTKIAMGPQMPGVKMPAIGNAVLGANPGKFKGVASPSVLKKPPAASPAVNTGRNLSQAMTSHTNMASR